MTASVRPALFLIRLLRVTGLQLQGLMTTERPRHPGEAEWHSEKV